MTIVTKQLSEMIVQTTGGGDVSQAIVGNEPSPKDFVEGIEQINRCEGSLVDAKDLCYS